MSEGKFKILSIDGGGIRVYIQARFLTNLKASRWRTYREHFDLICANI